MAVVSLHVHRGRVRRREKTPRIEIRSSLSMHFIAHDGERRGYFSDNYLDTTQLGGCFNLLP